MKQLLPPAVCILGAVLATACGFDGSSSYSQQPATPEKISATPAAAAAGITTAQNTLGTILTDTRGRALYLFEADNGATSTCTGACAKEWPPLTTTGAPSAGAGVNSALIATSSRADGTTQLTYNGHPLYYYDDDHGPGTTAGQGENSYGAKWYVLSPAGEKIDND